MEGHRTWAPAYDAGLNPLLSLETRLVLERLGPLGGFRFVDVACGTGRWMHLAHERGATVFGVDFCSEMLIQASGKAGLKGYLALADACQVPLADCSADFIMCSFAMSYLACPHQAIAEMARVSRQSGRITVTDLHPCALAAGWTRSFRSDGQVYEIDHHHHLIRTWETAAESAGLALDWCLEASFGEPERAIFRQAGKDSSFAKLSCIPALLAMSWIKS